MKSTAIMTAKFTQLRSFNSLDTETFGALFRKLGLVSAACYQIKSGKLIKIVSSENYSNCDWPVTADYTPNYTSFGGFEPLGWTKGNSDVSRCKDWPKGTNFYFPEQEIYDEKILFVGKNATGKRCKYGELNGVIEAAASRIRLWTDHNRVVTEFSDEGFQESVRAFGIDIKAVIDHELRTPLSSISGYLHLVQSLDFSKDKTEAEDYCSIIAEQTSYALEALEKLSYGMSNEGNEISDVDFKISQFDANDELSKICDKVRSETTSIIVSDKVKNGSKIRYQKNTDRECVLRADQRLFRWAMWEVMKNAIIHSKNAEISVEIYHSDEMLVIDITDDGQGVSEGAEELIFLRFYQDPRTLASRKGKRGLGLGLFLARHIVERHMGQLRFVRHPGRGSMFRFIWPAEAKATELKDLPKGA
jgi:signal transduction histidine kinase